MVGFNYFVNFARYLGDKQFTYIFKRDPDQNWFDQHAMSLFMPKAVVHYVASIEFYKDFCHRKFNN